MTDTGADPEHAGELQRRLAMYRAVADARVEALRAQVQAAVDRVNESLSRTERVTACWIEAPAQPSPPGANETRSGPSS